MTMTSLARRGRRQRVLSDPERACAAAAARVTDHSRGAKTAAAAAARPFTRQSVTRKARRPNEYLSPVHSPAPASAIRAHCDILSLTLPPRGSTKRRHEGERLSLSLWHFARASGEGSSIGSRRGRWRGGSVNSKNKQNGLRLRDALTATDEQSERRERDS